jgi:periplasmic divalent cation tolerance protein
VVSTVPSEEAGKRLASLLLEKKLVPCVNIVSKVRSIYTWKGKIHAEAEPILVMKRRASLSGRVRDDLKANRPYECPEVIAIPVVAVYRPYLDWKGENTVP